MLASYYCTPVLHKLVLLSFKSLTTEEYNTYSVLVLRFRSDVTVCRSDLISYMVYLTIVEKERERERRGREEREREILKG